MDFFEREVFPRLTPEAVFEPRAVFSSKTGRHWRGACPLHGGDNASAFSVDTVSLRWTCWTKCGGGSALDFLEWHNGRPTLHGRDYVEAVKRAAALAGVDASPLERELSPEEAERHEKHERRAGLLETFFAQAREALEGASGKAARDYLEGRGFKTSDAREPFGLFTTPEDVKRRLLKTDFSEAEVSDSGLLADGRWAGRLVLAWRDRRGNLETLASRDVTGKAETGEKYLRLRGGHASDLFGLDVALRAPETKAEGLVLVEGLFDALALHAHGLRNVAALGTTGRALGAEAWERFHGAGVRRVVLALDHDKAGREGLLASLVNADNAHNVPVVYVVDPEKLAPHKDPDELVRKKGLEAFRELVKYATRAATFRGLEALRGVDEKSPDAEKDAALARVFALVARLRGPDAAREREDLLLLAARATGHTTEAIAADAESHEELRRREAAERRQEAAVRDARAALDRGDQAALRRAALELSGTLGSNLGDGMAAPPPFSVDRLESESRALPSGLSSGWDALDRLGVRFNPGELSLVAARTGHGKTSALVGLLRHWLEVTDGPVVFYSLEEPEVRIFHRLLALLAVEEGRASGWAVDELWSSSEVRDYFRDPKGGNPRDGSAGAWPRPELLGAAKEKLRAFESRLLVVSRPSWTVDQISAHARELHRERRVGAVLVDYLQRLSAPEGSFDRRDLEVSAVARGLKALSVELSVPVVAGAQISRQAVEKKTIPAGAYGDEKVRGAIRSRRPELHHLREGGSEQEADLVLGLLSYRADFQSEAEEEDKRRSSSPVPAVTLLEVGTLKNRYGDVGRWAPLAFEGRFHLLRDWRDGEVKS